MKYVTKKHLKNYKIVGTYPNPAVFDAICKKTGKEIRITDITNTVITITPMTEGETKYHVGREGKFLEGHSSDGFFPKRAVAGIVNGVYSEDTPLAEKTGWVLGVGLGTMGSAFRAEKVDGLIEELKKNNFKVIYNGRVV